MEIFAPREIGNQNFPVNLSGYLMPVDENEQPTFLHIPGAGDVLFIPTFSSEEALKTYEAMPGSPAYAKIVQIQDGREFLSSIPSDLRIIIDIRPHDDPGKRARGCVRYTEVRR